MDFEKIIADIEKIHFNIYDFALAYEGKIHYHQFGLVNNCNDSYSVAKAFTMTAIGLLWDEDKLQMNDPFSKYFPEYFTDKIDQSWRLVTLEHAMKHRTGLSREIINMEEEDINLYPTDDYLELIFSEPLTYMPGSTHFYSEAPFYLLSRVVGKIAGERMDDFLLKRLVRPMKFREIAWSRDLRGYPVGSSGLYLSAADMVKLGMLYMQNGVYDGQRLLSEKWVKKVLENEYEMHAMTSHNLIGKGGWHGQGVCFQPDKGFAAAWHGSEVGEKPKMLLEYLDQLVL